MGEPRLRSVEVDWRRFKPVTEDWYTLCMGAERELFDVYYVEDGRRQELTVAIQVTSGLNYFASMWCARGQLDMVKR